MPQQGAGELGTLQASDKALPGITEPASSRPQPSGSSDGPLVLMDETTTVQLISHLSAIANSSPATFLEDRALQELLPVVSNLPGCPQDFV